MTDLTPAQQKEYEAAVLWIAKHDEALLRIRAEHEKQERAMGEDRHVYINERSLAVRMRLVMSGKVFAEEVNR